MIVSYSRMSVLVMLSCASACGEEEKPSVARRTCEQVCAKFEQCSDETDVTGCEDDCAAAAFRSNAFFRKQADCAEELACNRLVTPGGDSLCDDQADCPLWDCVLDELDVEPTEEQEAVCQEVGSKAEDCNAAVDDEVAEGQCLDAVVGMSDAYAEASLTCFRGACSGINACLDDLADENDANVRILSGDLGAEVD
jgi:hypothetical protein